MKKAATKRISVRKAALHMQIKITVTTSFILQTIY
jgi:hypothetical protein